MTRISLLSSTVSSKASPALGHSAHLDTKARAFKSRLYGAPLAKPNLAFGPLTLFNFHTLPRRRPLPLVDGLIFLVAVSNSVRVTTEIIIRAPEKTPKPRGHIPKVDTRRLIPFGL